MYMVFRLVFEGLLNGVIIFIFLLVVVFVTVLQMVQNPYHSDQIF